MFATVGMAKCETEMEVTSVLPVKETLHNRHTLSVSSHGQLSFRDLLEVGGVDMQVGYSAIDPLFSWISI